MKKTYEAPSLEVVKFRYRDQVVAASGKETCSKVWVNAGGTTCEGFQMWHGNQA